MPSKPSTLITCSANDCENTNIAAKGLCWKHYRRVLRHGQIRKSKPRPDPVSRFWQKVRKTDSCWIWVGSHAAGGYGQFFWRQRKQMAHRASYEIHFGDVPDNRAVIQVCGVRDCVRPDHLQLSQREFGDSRLCSFNGCDRKHRARGYCATHYVMWSSGRALQPIQERWDGTPESFWARTTIVDSGCWEWQGAKGFGNYGSFRDKYAHRVAWELANGGIPSNLLVCHHCDNPSCVNPDHLFLGTQHDNMSDRDRKGRAGMTKLSAEEVREIRRTYSTGELSIEDLATQYGVKPNAVYCVVTWRTWRWVE